MRRIADGPRYTVATPVRKRGVGLHTGAECVATLVPAPPDHGLRINGTPVHLDAVADSSYATTLHTAEGPVRTVEHLLAGLAGAGIDDVAVEIQGGEVPILDGSAGPWFMAIRPVAHGATRWVYVVEETLVVGSDARRITVQPAEVLSLEVHIDFPAFGPQRFAAPISDFTDVADARTFGFLADVEPLRQQGLIAGASIDNVLVFDHEGAVQNPSGARGPNEPARHKWLDLLGDLTLFGAPLRGAFEARFSGHALHHDLVRALLERRNS